MTMSLLEKAQHIVQARLHTLLNKQINTAEGYEQHIRKLQESLADIWAGVDEAQGELNGLERKKLQLVVEKDKNTAAAIQLRDDDDPTNDEQALTFMMRANAASDELASIDGQLVDVTATRDSVQLAARQIEAKVAEMSAELQQIRMDEAATKAKNRAASTLEAAQAASSDATGVNVDSIKAEIQRNKDVANARFDRVIGESKNTSSPEEALRRSRAAADLKALGSKVAETATAEEGSATS